MSSVERDLDDPTKTCVYIPAGAEEDIDDAAFAPSSPFQWRDLPHGQELRLQEYRAAWTKCLDRVQSIVEKLYAPVAEEVVAQVTHAYTDVLPGLPYPELPVIAISADSGSLSLYAEITKRLDGPEEDAAMGDAAPGTVAFEAHLYPADCPNITATMKAVVTGFVEESENGNLKRRPTTSLANYDINLLRAWYDAQEQPRNLLIFLHDFEQFDPAVIQDLFYICSLHVPSLPLVFLLALSSPPSPSYLQATYPRATLALLRVHAFSATSGPAIVEDILTKTFFDPAFEPDIMLGPATLEFIADWATRQSASLDALLTILQLAHMKHFEEPLTLLARAPPHSAALTAALHAPSALPFLAALHARLQPTPSGTDAPHAPTLLAEVSAAHTAFRSRARGVRVALGVAQLVRRAAHGDAHEGLAVLGAALRGRAARALGAAVRALPAGRLRALLGALHAFFDGLADAGARRAEEAARVRVVSALAQLPGPDGAELAAGVGDWVAEYLGARLVRLDEGALWDVWYTGASAVPAELLNPAPRATVVAALLRPHAFARAHARHAQASGGSEPEDAAGEESALPDTSFLFQQYTQAGRLINVYDWFEAFALELEGRRRRLPRRGGKGKGRARAREDADEEMYGGEEEEEEGWKEEVQARFIRALHELDFMGFVQHTGRKADHVMRTIYDLPD